MYVILCIYSTWGDGLFILYYIWEHGWIGAFLYRVEILSDG
jgi:hypothetical protein